MSMKVDESFRLPAWLEAELPSPRPVAKLCLRENRYVIEDCCGVGASYETLVEAYDAFREHRSHSSLVFSEECLELHEGKDGVIFAEGGRFLHSGTDEHSLWLLQETYRSWLNFYKEWQENPDDFLSSYYFVEQHPAFWTRMEEKKTFLWHTADGAPKRITPYRDDEGNVCVTIEAGGHIAPAYTEHYHDYRLDATSGTFEEAVIALAKQVDEVFDETGMEREAATDYPPPEYLKEAFEALRRHEK